MSAPRPHELTIDELREILRLPNHLIAIIKPDGTFYKVNEEANPVLGWEPGEVIGRKVKDYVHPEDWEETYAQMVSVFLGSKGVVEDMRNRIRRKDGTWRWVSWTGKAKAGLIYAHGNDVTEKMDYEEALVVQSLVLESISEGVIICNEKGLIGFANSIVGRFRGGLSLTALDSPLRLAGKFALAAIAADKAAPPTARMAGSRSRSMCCCRAHACASTASIGPSPVKSPRTRSCPRPSSCSTLWTADPLWFCHLFFL